VQRSPAIQQEKLMLYSLCNKKGMGLIEVLIAMFLTTVGIMALLSLQPSGWQTMAKSDYIGRASGILYKTLEDQETLILNPCNAVATGVQPLATVQVSGQSAVITGDMTYTVNTTIAQDGAAFVVTVTVTWPANATGISESLAVTRQELHRFPTGCPNA
jgi:Tfp pilus assembly protein PilV